MGGPGGPKKPIKKVTVRRVGSLFIPYKFQTALILVTVLISAGLSIVGPFFLKIIVNDGLVHPNLHIVTVYSLLTLVTTIASTLLGLYYGWLSVDVGQLVMRDLRSVLYKHLQGMSLKFFTATRTGEIQSRLANDVGGIQSVVSDTITNVLASVTTVLSTIVAMVIMDWRLTILSVGIMPVFGGVAAVVGEKMRKYRGEVQTQLADLNATMAETLSVSGVLLIKTSGREALTLNKFEGTNEKLKHINVRMSMVFRTFFTVMNLTFGVTPVLVYWLAGYLLAGGGGGGLTIGTIVAFTALQSRLFFPLMSLLNVQVEVTSAFALFDRIFEYLDLKQDIVNKPGAEDIPVDKVKGAVEFRGVTFRYDPSQETPTLDGVNLEAYPGELVALVGASGSGKTTLTYLIPRLYDVESGSVRIDGHDVRDLTLETLSRSIAVVTQETYLVHDTIRENLRYGNPDATDDQIIEAAKSANIHAHISGLPEGYDTVVGERGYKLSGGEKQRVAIARAILKDPKILILDEATSSLDTHSERLVQAALAELMAGRTTFAVAHRLSTISAAQEILVLKNGYIVERGTHQELLEHGGEYNRLYQLQFETEGEPAVSNV